jgi:flagellar protein FlgJ
MDIRLDPRTVVSNSTIDNTNDKQRKLESLRESSRDFEQIFVMEVFKAMRKAIPEGGLFEKSSSTEMFQEMLDMETVKAATKSTGFGIADAMYKQMADIVENKK